MFDDYLRQILERDPTGHIVLLLGKPSPLTERFINRMQSVVGETLFRRVIILPQQHVQQYYRYLSVSTVILHSPIYSGEITAVDGFLYGIPSAAQTGELLIQRYTAALYKDFGIDGPAASSKEEYIEQAVKLGTDPEYRHLLSDTILANRDRFFENANTIRQWELFLSKAVTDSQKIDFSEKREETSLGESSEQLFQRLALKYPWPTEKPNVPGNLQGWCDEPNQKMLSSLIDDTTKIIVEIGSWLGDSARFMLESTPDAKIICIDHWFGSKEHRESGHESIREKFPTLYETFLVNLWEDRFRVVPLRTDSVHGLREIHRLGLKPDLIYIDASHDYQNVFEDVKTALDLFPDSTICGDDWHYEDVRRAVGELAQEYRKKIIAEGNRVWRFEKETRQIVKASDQGDVSYPQQSIPDCCICPESSLQEKCSFHLSGIKPGFAASS
jgi:hypothetical protein